jgi:hypothetical protein
MSPKEFLQYLVERDFRLLNPAPPRYFSPAVERFEIKRELILKAFDPDFSGQKWTLRKSSGGQNGWGGRF